MLLVQCAAHCILSSRGEDTPLKHWGLRLCQRGGSNAKKQAVVAVARKLAVLLHKITGQWTVVSAISGCQLSIDGGMFQV
jgi:hypothetical protein